MSSPLVIPAAPHSKMHMRSSAFATSTSTPMQRLPLRLRTLANALVSAAVLSSAAWLAPATVFAQTPLRAQQSLATPALPTLPPHGASPASMRRLIAGPLAQNDNAPPQDGKDDKAGAGAGNAAGSDTGTDDSTEMPDSGSDPILGLSDSALSDNNDPQDLPNHELTSQVMFQVLAAEIALQRGQAAPAFQTYLSLARSTQDPRMAQRAAGIAVAAQSPSDALTAARLWHQYAPHSSQASQFDATLLVLNGYLDEARPLLARQLAAVPDPQRGNAILALQGLIAKGPDRIGGVRALKQLLADDMQRPEAPTAIGRQQIVANDRPAAQASFESALKLQPDYAPAALLLAQMGADQRRQVIASVSDYSQQHPKAREPRFLLAQVYLADNQMDAARKQFEILHKADPTDPAPLFALGLIAMQAKQLGEAEKDFVAYVQLAEKQTTIRAGAQVNDPGPAYLYLAQLAAARQDTSTANDWLMKVQPQSSQYVTAQIARAELLTAQKRYDDALSVLGAVQPRNAQELVTLGRARASVLMQAGKYTEAQQRLAALMQLIPNDPDIIYDYAMAAEKAGDYPLMEQELRRLIAVDPTNAQALNALGYSMADRNENLDEADKLVQKAMALAPNDPYITDSAGWVKFRLGDKDAAVTLLRRAYALQPNAEIGAHLGEVLWSEGKQDEAHTVLQAAQQLDPTDETLLGTLARLKVNLNQ